ncbi:uncharacterized protein MICPUCDRAFT_55288 [Micromonas pusilla CCMP1545]|uniref:Predicted protein n=1 Tax=Micromonas pusilla (strain CCMP1545) TaxID=564608 RepID=C1MKC8_MICPC|nr:uncharacterized protein MICPUCDRAFT_55288 [Micromonas pusilla CCMP1545]EEH59349.1 predicted protein [Micromonas pusilla CCMP1545]|eukprot:XP_003055973.1 predicted protein [Micromonas pusilla CCMP1545]
MAAARRKDASQLPRLPLTSSTAFPATFRRGGVRADATAEAEADEDVDEIDEGDAAADGDANANAFRIGGGGGGGGFLGGDDDAVPCTEGEDAARDVARRGDGDGDGDGGGDGARARTKTLMGALSRIPLESSANDASAGACGQSSARGDGPVGGGGAAAHKHGAGAPTARLQRIMQRVRAQQARFASRHAVAGGGGGGVGGDSGAESAAAKNGWGEPLEITLLGNPGREGNLYLWECSLRKDEEHVARGGGASGGGGGDGSGSGGGSWLRREGDDDARARAARTAVAMHANVAHDIMLRSKGVVYVHPPWHEAEILRGGSRGGRKRARILFASHVTAAEMLGRSVAAVPATAGRGLYS